MKVNSRAKIINILKKTNKAISGEDISKTIGISRTAVWKNVKKLIEEGYTISSHPNGYILKKETDLLIPYEFDNESNLYIYEESTESTMDIARDLVTKGKVINGTVVVTETQTKGKANFGKEFISPKGGLYFTILLQPNCPIMDVNLYPMAALAAVKEVLHEELSISTISKWPFENWHQGKKISGILPEYKIENNRVKWINLGIGINLDMDIPRRGLLISLKSRILEYINNRDSILTYYTNSLNILNRRFKFISENKITIGSVKSIDKLGTLTLITEKGLEYAYIGNSSQEDEN